MTFDPPVTCPVCEEVLELDRDLEDHLIGKHTQREVARYVVSQQERAEIEPVGEAATPNYSSH
ncbi:hypothetical protein [Natronococcus jeotgali]|uniref:C2H2-type domain-containing protein n=1 Tax=Natronococcus jeotgali DSM 18795 TaxID=1227498 RepID=L9XUK1_9EURY|nr:hypothetical protein [Natronococcus jeotgali]ELY65440.1 hypothetical protein C492_03966 [Natronococcus jeotgali DSM 18795]